MGLACGGTIDVLVSPRVPEAAVDGRPRDARGAGRRPGHRDAAARRRAAGGVRARTQPGPGAEPPGRSSSTTTARSTGTLGDAAADAALRRRPPRTRCAHGVSRTVEIAGRQLFIEAYPVRPRLVVVGAVEVARTLVRLAKELGYETVVIDGRAAFATEARFPDVDRLLVGWPDEVADEIGLGPADAVAVLTHDVKFDEPAIVEALAPRLPLRRRRGLAQDPGRPPRAAARGGRGARRRSTGSAARSGSTSAVGCRPRRRSRSWPRSSPSGAAARGARCGSSRAGRGGQRRRPAPSRERAAMKVARRSCSRPVPARGSAAPKLLAPLDGRPLLQHVLDAVAAAGLDDVVVVLGDGRRDSRPRSRWRGERRVVNPRPQDGLSSSLRVGLDAALEDDGRRRRAHRAGRPAARPPRGHPRALDRRRRGGSPSAPFVRARYADGRRPEPGPRSAASAWALAAGSPATAASAPCSPPRPDLVLAVAGRRRQPRRRHARGPPSLAGRIGTRDDARRSAAAADAWRPPGPSASAPTASRPSASARPRRRDFYAPVSSLFVADPRRTGEPALDALLATATGARRGSTSAPAPAATRCRWRCVVARGHRRRAVGGHAPRAADRDGGARDRQRPRRRRRLAGRARRAGRPAGGRRRR